MSAFGMGAPVQAKSDGSFGEGAVSAGGFSGGAEGKSSVVGGPVQMKTKRKKEQASLHDMAQAGVAGAGGELPFLDQIQHAFGAHDVSGIQAHTGGAAAEAANSMGAEAYATGNDVAFGGSPSLHTAAHEAAHVVQQRAGVQLKGGVGEVGDSYESHADSVADAVVQGKSAEGLLSQMAPAGGGGGASVQHKALQFDASVPELQSVVFDAQLLADLRDDLSQSDMARVLDLINAPLAAKLRLAIDGWLTNNHAYITRSLERATPVELASAGGDTALVNELIDTLGSAFLKTVLDRMQVPLARKLEYAMSGWSNDEQYIYSSIQNAPIDQVTALLSNASLLAKLDAENFAGMRARIAKRIFPGGGTADAAFTVIVTNDDTLLDTRLEEYGSIPQQRTLLDGVIVAGLDAIRVQRAFHAYWHVQVTSAAAAAATTSGGDNGAPSPAVAARNWPVATLQAIHNELKAIPNQDARTGVWNRLSLTNDPALINRAAYLGGNFSVGSNASTTSANPTGYSTSLTANAALHATTLVVTEGGRFAVGDQLALDRTGPNRDLFRITAITGNTYTIDTALTHAHSVGDTLMPDDGSGTRMVNWLAATVRHEIAHSLDGGGVDTKAFYALGDWWLGSGDAGFDTWALAMGASAWTPNDGTTLSATDKATIKATIVDHTMNQKGTLTALPLAHVVRVNLAKAVPVIVAAEKCLALGDNFWTDPTGLYAAGGKRFSISRWYKRFQSHNESVVSQRVADYGLYAPTEFFAEAYTVFYEEAGKTPAVPDADYGRLIRSTSQRQWIRDHVHNRGLAPAGTGAATGPGGTPAPSTGPELGARGGGASTGRSSGNPGM
ncbi:MAG: DUF4157 domain-containing protein [Proteobacteria bacterium]|nr:DUF4157 domain-containing protein [Pseudomonadota bacterium]